MSRVTFWERSDFRIPEVLFSDSFFRSPTMCQVLGKDQQIEQKTRRTRSLPSQDLRSSRKGKHVTHMYTKEYIIKWEKKALFTEILPREITFSIF